MRGRRSAGGSDRSGEGRGWSAAAGGCGCDRLLLSIVASHLLLGDFVGITWLAMLAPIAAFVDDGGITSFALLVPIAAYVEGGITWLAVLGQWQCAFSAP